MEKKYSILQVCVDLDGGGIDRYLYNYCTIIQDIHFDFAAIDNKNGILEKPLTQYGYNIYKIPRITQGFIQNYKAFKRVMSSHHYDAVHVHLGFYGFLALLAAKKCGIKTRIVHAHIAFVPENYKEKMIRKILTFVTKRLATNMAACGIDAAKWVWGENSYKEGKVIVHNNAINTNLYKFNNDQRIATRKSLGISDETLLVGHIGRLCDQKNQKRLIEIFYEISKEVDNSKLILLGFKESSYSADLEVLIKKYSLQDKVFVLGVRDDVHILLNAMDVFVFPSKFEGLPFTLIETQCNGLYSLSSSAVSKYVKVSDCLDFLSLNENNKTWAEKAISLSRKGHCENAIKQVVSAGYDLEVEASKLKTYYLSLIKKNA